MNIVKCAGRKSAKKYYRMNWNNNSFVVSKKSILGFIFTTAPYIKFISIVLLGLAYCIALVFGIWAICSGIEGLI